MRSIIVLILCLATPAFAAPWVFRDGDQMFEKEALETRLRGQIITFFDGGQAEYYTDGRYTYTYSNDGGTGYGQFEVGEDSTICISFVTGFKRCDAYVLDARERLVVITEKGDRFPVR